SIWSLVDGTWSELRPASENWTHNDFVKPLGQKNQLTVIFVGNHLIGSVNQKTVADVEVDSAAIHPGAVGLYLGTTDSVGPTMLVDTYEVSGSIPSMTGQ